ncbi:MAG: hypothetical protein E7665_01830 [Ruminococcaceae bacterium]|nr:hypothetical protein [Oscillospiraceae bacterium]
MIRIGVVNIDTSHPNTFAARMAQGDRARYTAIYNDGFRENDEVEAFMAKNGIEKRYTDLSEMAENVDVGFIQGCNWDKHLEYAEPFIKAGKPVFIDKPIVGSMKDIKKLNEYVRSGAVILGSSSVRYAKEICDFLALPKESRGEIVNVYGTSGVDEFNYGIHITEGFGGLIDSDAVSCKHTGTAEAAGKKCESYIVKYANGVTASYSLFIGSWHPFTLTVQTTRTTYNFKIDSAALYDALLTRLFDSLESGEMKTASVDKLCESVKIMLAGKISLENGDKEVLLADIPEDYEGYDGYAFEKGYAASSKKIYL